MTKQAQTTKTQTRKPAQASSSIKYAIADFARPSAGAALAAHTMAFLTLSGLAEGKTFPKAEAVKVMGSRAIGYHTREKNNFELTPEGLKLTEKGTLFFIHRGEAEPELVKAYTEVMTTGKVNKAANVKTESARIALK